uniref:Degenerin mec-10-like n=1 Tax=Crassostrea virginica TaxID=6565 RepID=A0A8B8EZR9_CRAVI|nr:degenerin mec-10-like [Crassostrea virginica]
MYKSVPDVISSLVSESSLHGLPKILSSKHWYQRVLWICLVLVTFGFLLYQLHQLLGEYKRYPVKTKVSMKRATLPFPAVSFCNMNPIKKSRMTLINKTGLHDHMARKLDESARDEYNVLAGYNDYYSYKNNVDYQGHTDKNSTINESLVTNETNYYDQYYHDSYSDDTKFDSAWNDFIHYRAAQKELKNDPRSEDIKQFMILFHNVSRDTRVKMGHSIKDLLINCSFNGKLCSAQDFTLFQTLEFGNCYTLSNTRFLSRSAGPLHGLKMILQVETFEHVNEFVDGTGIRLVIHEPGTLSFPAEEGFTLSSGYETSIGMKMVSLSKSEEPYGKCVDGKDFYRIYGVRYTVTTCVNLCRTTKVIDACNCRPSENIADITYMDQFAHLPVCLLVNETTLNGTNNFALCEEYVLYQIEEDFINCECESACSETIYKSTLSGRSWPKESFINDELTKTACSNYNYSYCTELKSTIKKIDHKDNFLKFVIYYEDLNFKEIVEEPLYDVFHFLSDIGGTLGLFLGASLMSFVEIVQLILEILNYFRNKCSKDKPKVKKKNCTSVEPIEGFKVKIGVTREC